MEFDIDGISGEGFEIITPIVITNTNSYSGINVINEKEVEEKEVLLKLT